MTKHSQGFAVPALRLCQNLRADLNSFQLKVGPPDLFANIIPHSYHSDLDDTCCERSPHGLTNAGATYTSISTTCAIPPTSIRPCLPGLRTLVDVVERNPILDNMENAYVRSAQDVLRQFKVSEGSGLSTTSVSASREKYGRNGMHQQKQPRICV